MVDVTVDTESVENKSDDFFTEFSVICATCCTKAQLLRINKISHENNIMFFAGDVFGFLWLHVLQISMNIIMLSEYWKLIN